MNIETAREYCLSKKQSEESFPFDETTLVFKVMGKMFAMLMLDKPDMIVLKCDAEYALDLREHYAAVEPAFHFNKKYWNQIHFNMDVDDGLLMTLIDHSLDEVVKKFTKKMREEYNTADE
ncbi:MAG: MmcQ/YjbR family DNA-binding protein [Prevotella sp.]